MKIYIIRHGKVDMKCPKRCKSKDFDVACNQYDQADIENIGQTLVDIQCDDIYVSHLLRSLKTAQILLRKQTKIL